ARGAAFSLVTFLLATQEKVTRAPGGAWKKTRRSKAGSKALGSGSPLRDVRNDDIEGADRYDRIGNQTITA
ncbi:MAG: hypothetical protein KJS83_12790, partial [Xanthomonadaceae bacterium]|nr:hypothetical protein [Xanthomonadaceae bacterium]